MSYLNNYITHSHTFRHMISIYIVIPASIICLYRSNYASNPVAKKNISSSYHLPTYPFPHFQIYLFFYIRRISNGNHVLDNYSLEYVYVQGKTRLCPLRVEDTHGGYNYSVMIYN